MPETSEQYLSAVYTWWNLLDDVMHAHRGAPIPRVPYGYMRLTQLRYYSRLARQMEQLRGGARSNYCEVGVNGGHGTVAMLLANPSLVAHSWDQGIQPFSPKVFELLRLHFGARIHLHVGDSHELLPPFAANASHKGMCDLLLIDGDHSDGAYYDMRDMQPLAACDAPVLLDDIVGTHEGKALGVQRALQRATYEGILRVVRRFEYNITTRDNPCLCVWQGLDPPPPAARPCDRLATWDDVRSDLGQARQARGQTVVCVAVGLGGRAVQQPQEGQRTYLQRAGGQRGGRGGDGRAREVCAAPRQPRRQRRRQNHHRQAQPRRAGF